MVDGPGLAETQHARMHGSSVHTVAGRVPSALCLALPALLAVACSPTAFAVRERAAVRALAAADAEGAESHAIYEWVLARRYLDKAREESAEAHYGWALSLLAQSEQSALRARKLSEERARARPTLPLVGAVGEQAAP